VVDAQQACRRSRVDQRVDCLAGPESDLEYSVTRLHLEQFQYQRVLNRIPARQLAADQPPGQPARPPQLVGEPLPLQRGSTGNCSLASTSQRSMWPSFTSQVIETTSIRVMPRIDRDAADRASRTASSELSLELPITSITFVTPTMSSLRPSLP
jgi:hypothetical protein